MARHPRVKLGDVLSIPLEEKRFCCGQVIEKKTIIYVVVFRKLYVDPPSFSQAILESPILAGWTADAEIYYEGWKIIGNLPPYKDENLRNNSKVLYEGNVWVKSFEGEMLHKASDVELKTLHNWSSYSPTLFEDAIRAFHRLEPWRSDFDGLLLSDS